MERVAKEWDGQISIHAPVKGATRPILYNANETAFISIHAPVKGATSGTLSELSDTINFNPRPREGSDVAIKLSTYRRFKFQSTPP